MPLSCVHKHVTRNKISIRTSDAHAMQYYKFCKNAIDCYLSATKIELTTTETLQILNKWIFTTIPC